MAEMYKKNENIKFDSKEFELPQTLMVRDIENRVFQGIVLQCLSKIEGINLVEGNFIDNILGRDSLEGIRGIHVEQDSKKQCVSFRVEVNICYGISIPQKADEIQNRIAEEVTKLSGLHVSSIHVVFKTIVQPGEVKSISELLSKSSNSPVLLGSDLEEEYNDEF
jgi:uncharacterized alkaline shock family protein YloU